MNHTIEHERLKDAAKRVAARKQAYNDAQFKKYRTRVLSAPVELRQIGLIQLTAFWASKGDECGDLLQDTVESLLSSTSTAEPAKPLSGYEKDPESILNKLLDMDSRTVVLLEREAEAWMTFAKRVTEGYWQEIKRQKELEVKQQREHSETEKTKENAEESDEAAPEKTGDHR